MKNEHKKLERLILFSEVAQTLNFTEAAENIGISRGHLSAQIKKLETDMGVPLFVRSTRSVRLTLVGEQMMLDMDKIRLAMLELERNTEKEVQTIEGVIKMTAPPLFTDRYLLDITTKFKKLHPAVSFSIDCSYTSYDLNRSDFDLAFRATQKPPLNMVAKPLLPYHHTFCAAPSYFNKKGKPTTFDELKHHQCIKEQGVSHWTLNKVDIPITGWLQINDNALSKQIALSGKGITRLPSYCVEKEIAAGRLEAIFESHSVATSMIQIIYPQLIQQSKRVNAFINYTVKQFKTKR